MPTNPLLLQIVPPGAGGVRDCLDCLRIAWATQGVAAHTVELSKELAARQSLYERVEVLRVASAAERCVVIVHYSGYGYARRGLCFWLLHELESLRARYGTRLRLVTVFHELYASGPVSSSAFWLSPLQEFIAARLARMADAMWTNTEHHAAWLGRLSGGSKPLHVHPVFSNVGEAPCGSTASSRSNRVVVFGSAATRQRAFSALRSDASILHRLGIEEVIEIGPGGHSECDALHVPRRHVGRLDGSTLAALLVDSRFGLIDYPPQYLGKSSVFAAYAAFGCVVLNTAAAGRDTDGLAGGRDYLSLSACSTAGAALAGSVQLDAIAKSLHRWYARHPLNLQAHQLLSMAVA